MPNDTLKKGHSGAKKNSFPSFLCNLEYIYLFKKYKFLMASLYALRGAKQGGRSQGSLTNNAWPVRHCIGRT